MAARAEREGERKREREKERGVNQRVDRSRDSGTAPTVCRISRGGGPAAGGGHPQGGGGKGGGHRALAAQAQQAPSPRARCCFVREGERNGGSEGDILRSTGLRRDHERWSRHPMA